MTHPVRSDADGHAAVDRFPNVAPSTDIAARPPRGRRCSSSSRRHPVTIESPVAANLVVSRGVVPVRDSKNPDGPVLDIPAASFASFVASVKTGEFGTF